MFLGKGIIYFAPGRKYPKIIMDNYEYKLRKNNSSEKKTTWICTQPGCKVRMMSREKSITVKAVQHNHGPTYRGDYANLKSQILNIECTKERFD